MMFENSIENSILTFKNSLFAKKRSEFHKRSIKDFPDFIKNYSADELKNGDVGIYLKPVLRDSDDKRIYWLIFDIESAEHDNLERNIEAARAFLIWLIENGLIEGLKIICTGSGFRFVWPYLIPKEYGKAFNAFMDDHKEIIDAQPFKNQAFLRIFGYRGHRRQEKKDKLRDVHLHMLDDYSELMELTADRYLKLIAGKPNDDFIKWLPKILPNNLPTASWFNLLDEYKRKIRLRDSIFQTEFNAYNTMDLSYSGIWNQIDSYLDQRGIIKQESFIGNDRTIFKLSECPICGRGDASPYVTYTGKLKCWHRNSCSAGKQDETGKPIGLRPSEWVDGFQGLDFGEMVFPDADDRAEKVSIDDARKRIADAIINGTDDLVITMTPGAGKSTTSLFEIVPTCKDKKVLYISSSKTLNQEIFDKAEDIAKDHGVDVHWIRGRDSGNDERDPNCYKIDQVNQVAERGFSPGLIVCPKCEHNRKPKSETLIENKQRVEVLNDDRCPYQQQFDLLKNNAGLFISTHHQAGHLINRTNFDLLIIDENPVQVFMEKTCVGWAPIDAMQAGMSSSNKEVFGKIHDVLIEQLEALQEKGSGHARIYSKKPPDNSQRQDAPTLFDVAEINWIERRTVLGDLGYYMQLEGESNAERQLRLYKKHVNLKAIDWLCTAFDNDPNSTDDATTYVRIDKKSQSNPFKFYRFKQNVPDFKNRIIILDGTGDKAEADALFKRDFKLIEADVELKNCKTVWFQQALGKTKASKLNDEQIKKLLSKIIPELKITDHKILIGTFMNIENRVLNIAKELLPGKQVEVSHYWADRGKNSYEHFDAFIAFGTPAVNHNSLLDESMSLFPDEPDMQKTWCGNMGKHELIQKLHRIRPVNGDKTLIIMGREWPPKLGKPSIHIDMRRTNGKGQDFKGCESDKTIKAYERLKWFVSEHGFITKEIAWALGVGCSRELESLKLIQKQVESLIENSKCQNDVCCLIRYIILDITHQKSVCSKLQANSLIVLGDSHSWDNLLVKLKEDFPDLPDLKQSGQIYNFKKTKGLGYITDVKAFYSEVGKTFEPDSWEGVEREPGSNQDQEVTQQLQQIESLYMDYMEDLETMTSRKLKRAQLKDMKKQAKKLIRNIKSNQMRCAICGGPADTMGIHAPGHETAALNNGMRLALYPVCSGCSKLSNISELANVAAERDLCGAMIH